MRISAEKCSTHLNNFVHNLYNRLIINKIQQVKTVDTLGINI